MLGLVLVVVTGPSTAHAETLSLPSGVAAECPACATDVGGARIINTFEQLYPGATAPEISGPTWSGGSYVDDAERIVSDLFNVGRSSASSVAGSEAVAESTVAIGEGAGVLPTAAAVGGALGPLALGAAAAGTGYLIGTGIRKLYGRLTKPAQAGAGSFNPRLVWTPYSASTSWTTMGLVDPEDPAQQAARLPTSGAYVWTIDVAGAWTVTTPDPNCGYQVSHAIGNCGRPNVPAVAHVFHFRGGGPCGGCATGEPYRDAGYSTVAELHHEALRRATGSDTGTTVSAPSLPSRTSIKSGIEASAPPASDPFWPKMQCELDSASCATDPTVLHFTMPNCVGQSVGWCASSLDLAGHTGTRTWTTLSLAAADLSKPAGAIVTTSPTTGSTAAADAAVTGTENPDPLPFVIPAPGAHETYGAYVARLQSLGFLGTVTRSDLTDATLDPQRGPNEAVSTDPATGTRVANSTGTAIAVRTNPQTAPDPSGEAEGTVESPTGSGPFTPPTIPALDLGPITATTPCDVFPFGVPCWVGDALGEWIASPETPEWTFHFPFGGDGGNMHVDLALFDDYMPTIRALLLVVSIIGMAWFFMSAALGFGTGTKEGD